MLRVFKNPLVRIAILVSCMIISISSAQKLNNSGATSIEPVSSGIVWGYVDVQALAVLFFGVVVIGLEVFLVYKLRTMWSSMDAIKVIGITLIITAVLFAAILGYSLGENMLTAIVGLLGTLAGYLLASTGSEGRASREEH